MTNHFSGWKFKSKIKLNRYLQLMFNVTVVSRRWPSGIARFHTTHRYFAPSSSRCGVTDNVLVVWRSFDPPRLIGACNGIALPSRYQLKLVTKYKPTLMKFVWNSWAIMVAQLIGNASNFHKIQSDFCLICHLIDT